MWEHDNFPVELLRRLPQQLDVGDAIAVAGQNYLPGIPTLRNMMGNINHDNASEAGP